MDKNPAFAPLRLKSRYPTRNAVSVYNSPNYLKHTFEAGKAYYIGDYEGFFTFSKWKLKNRKNNFGETTKKMREKFKFFDKIECVSAIK